MEVNMKQFQIGQSDSEYWSWFTFMLFLLIPLDILSTSFAIRLYGVQGELNPLMRVLFMADWYIFLIVNVGVAIMAIGFFNGVLAMGEITPIEYKKRYYFVVELWMGAGIAFGIGLLVSNLMVVFYGYSLFLVILQLLGLA